MLKNYIFGNDLELYWLEGMKKLIKSISFYIVFYISCEKRVFEFKKNHQVQGLLCVDGS